MNPPSSIHPRKHPLARPNEALSQNEALSPNPSGASVSSITELHPEELFDKQAAGTISPEELSQLEQHLERCELCRLERAVRGAFQHELSLDEQLVGTALGAALRQLSEQEPSEQELSALPTGNTASPSEAPPKLPRPAHRPRKGLRRLAVGALLLASSAAAAWQLGVPQRLLGNASLDAPGEASPAAPAQPTPPRSLSGAEGDGSEAERAEPESVKPESVEPEASFDPAAQAQGSTELAQASANQAHTRPGNKKSTKEISPPKQEPLVAPSALNRGADGGPKSERTPASLFEQATRARRSGDLAAAEQQYTKLTQEFPQSREAQTARAILAQLAVDRGELSQAVGHYNAYLTEKSAEAPLSEEALIGRARALSRLGAEADERAAWQRLLSAYPDSSARAEAVKRLATLGHQ